MAERGAGVEDLDDLAMSLPDVTRELSPAGLASYQVHGKTFVFFREPRPDAVDPATGERMDDVICLHVPDQSDKDALVAEDGPFFTTPHFNGYKAVLLRQRDLGRVTLEELGEVIADAWLARAPKRLARAWLDGRGEGPH